jgi:hypothetical protein
MRNRMIGLASIFAGAVPYGLALTPTRSYGPCTGCGNPCKGGQLCFKCERKTLDAILQETNKSGEAEPASEQTTIIVVSPSGDRAEPQLSTDGETS